MSTRLIENRQRGACLDKMTDKERLFCLEMCANKTFRPTEAAKAAGYAGAPQAAVKLMKRSHIKAFLGKVKREREERTPLSSDQIWEYLHRILFFDPRQYFRPASSGNGEYFEITAKSMHELPEEVAQLIEGAELRTEYNSDGEPESQYYKIKMISKATALGIAAKHAIPQRHIVNHPIDFDALYEPVSLLEADIIDTEFQPEDDEDN